MTSSKIKFIATDMDGTLLDNSKVLSPDFHTLFPRLEQAGILFAAASGRQYYSLLETFSAQQNEMVFIAENGTLVMYKGEELYSATIDRDEITQVIETTRAIDDAFIVLCGKKSAYIETQDPTACEEIARYYHRCEYVDDLLSVEDEFIKVAILHFGGTEALVYPSIHAAFGDSHQVVVSAAIWLDVMNARASKGDAIRHLQETMGFTYEETMSFGDYFNDVEMLEASYHAYAMENAHEKVKAYARFIAPSNEDKGVYVVLERLLEQRQ
ncbi:HAD family hydrolase [Thaumasiovibrio subtropicus]|uniref:HAD family hydrolase n=1 Tax=Thaumasiovibrio subtropicus TaxID=1891207 RepID=UPI000B361BE6|nr:HAD family hydrolase [Thaumasiovibrio subtropicus]